MTIPIKPTEYTIDAKGRPFGRVVSEVAVLISGKRLPDYSRNSKKEICIHVLNVDKVKFSGKKDTQKVYYSHTRYPGRLITTRLQERIVKNPKGLFISSLKHMLPKNRLQKQLLRSIKFE